MWRLILVKLLGAIIPRVTPSIRGAVVDMVEGLDKLAKSTDNTWDDYLVDTLKALLGIGPVEK